MGGPLSEPPEVPVGPSEVLLPRVLFIDSSSARLLKFKKKNADLMVIDYASSALAAKAYLDVRVRNRYDFIFVDGQLYDDSDCLSGGARFAHWLDQRFFFLGDPVIICHSSDPEERRQMVNILNRNFTCALDYPKGWEHIKVSNFKRSNENLT